MNRTMKLRVVALLIAVLMAVPASLAFAAGKSKRKSVRGQGRKTVDSYQTAPAGGGASDLGTSTIEGRIFKPAVFFVLARSDFQYQAIGFKQTFVDRIVIGALHRPF